MVTRITDRRLEACITVTFLFDADIVQSLKMLAPNQRTFDPVSKAWKLDLELQLLALPLMLENRLPLGYNLQCPRAPSKFGVAYTLNMMSIVLCMAWSNIAN